MQKPCVIKKQTNKSFKIQCVYVGHIYKPSELQQQHEPLALTLQSPAAARLLRKPHEQRIPPCFAVQRSKNFTCELKLTRID